MTPQDTPPPQDDTREPERPEAGKTERERRLEARLRENLKRRKEQARGRRQAPEAETGRTFDD